MRGAGSEAHFHLVTMYEAATGRVLMVNRGNGIPTPPEAH